MGQTALEGEAFSAAAFGQTVASIAPMLGVDYSTLLQILITYALLLGQIESTPVGGELRTPPPYVKVTTPSGKRFEVGLWGTRTA